MPTPTCTTHTNLHPIHQACTRYATHIPHTVSTHTPCTHEYTLCNYAHTTHTTYTLLHTHTHHSHSTLVIHIHATNTCIHTPHHTLHVTVTCTTHTTHTCPHPHRRYHVCIHLTTHPTMHMHTNSMQKSYIHTHSHPHQTTHTFYIPVLCTTHATHTHTPQHHRHPAWLLSAQQGLDYSPRRVDPGYCRRVPGASAGLGFPAWGRGLAAFWAGGAVHRARGRSSGSAWVWEGARASEGLCPDTLGGVYVGNVRRAWGEAVCA